MNRVALRAWCLVISTSLALLLAPTAHALTLEAPVGGAAIPVGSGLVACGASGAWTLEAGGAQVRPPSADSAAGTSVVIKVAPSLGACSQSKQQVTLLALGHYPQIDPASVTLFVDEARVEAHGRGLKGAQIRWLGPGHSGTDTCPEPKGEASQQSCAWVVGRDLSADPGADTLRLLPAFALVGEGQRLFDAQGQPILTDGVPLQAARIVIGKVLTSDSAIDLSMGRTELSFVHPEAVAGADCNVLDCALASKKLVVTSTAPVTSADLRVRLAPRVFYQHKGALEVSPSFKLPVLHCAMTLISGAPVRKNDAAKLVVRLDRSCVASRQLYRFTVGDAPLRVLGDADTEEGLFVVLELGSYSRDELEVTARRSDTDAVVAVLTTPTRAAPSVRTALSLSDGVRVDFVPTNRPAIVNVSRLAQGEHWQVISVPNVYNAGQDGHHDAVTGDPDAAGFTQLELALRNDAVPAALGEVDLAVVQDPLQRKIQQANVPVALGAGALVEFKCGPSGRSVTLHPGDPVNLPFAWRDSCRITVHRERLRKESGRQRIALSVDVYSSDGASRSEGHIKDTLEIGPGPEPRQIWISGVTTPFDRIVVRVAHDAGESHYVGGSELYASGPAVQWSVVLGTGHARIYATSAIPAGLYRFGDKDHSGLLSLNFGLISRLTWLDKDGKEGLLGLEGGVMVIGLASSTSTTGHSLTEVGVPVGLGLSIPIANRLSTTEASINLHGWLEIPISRDDHTPAFIFGPSISIGNIGANL
ncbi:MAG TPA: hypothetical protein VHB79_38565 [Polyangiaceae bacterium]|nr:hypothetical protein [Polyangiaceae bacterium]